jgi:hypothetical protein
MHVTDKSKNIDVQRKSANLHFTLRKKCLESTVEHVVMTAVERGDVDWVAKLQVEVMKVPEKSQKKWKQTVSDMKE